MKSEKDATWKENYRPASLMNISNRCKNSKENVSKPQFSSVAQSCPTLCDPMNRSMPGLSVHHQLPEFTQIHVHWVSDAIQPSLWLYRPFLLSRRPNSYLLNLTKKIQSLESFHCPVLYLSFVGRNNMSKEVDFKILRGSSRTYFPLSSASGIDNEFLSS